MAILHGGIVLWRVVVSRHGGWCDGGRGPWRTLTARSRWRIVGLLAGIAYWLVLVAIRAWYSFFLALIGVGALRGALNAAEHGESGETLWLGGFALTCLALSLLLFYRASRQVGPILNARASRRG